MVKINFREFTNIKNFMDFFVKAIKYEGKCHILN